MNGPNVYRALAAEGLTQSEAAARLGVCRNAVRLAAKRHSIVFVGRLERTVARVRACAERGMTKAETLREIGLEESHIRRIARANGIVFLGRGERTLMRARACAEKGMTRRETARALGVSKQLITQIVVKHGVRFAVDRGRGPVSPAAHLSPQAQEDYRLFRRKRFTVAEALAMAGGARA